MQLMSGIPWETVTLTTLSRDRTLFPLLLSEARDLAMVGQDGKLVIHTAWGIEWKPFGLPRRKRPLRSVVLAEGVSEKIERDLQSFLRRRQWYADRGAFIDLENILIAIFTSSFCQASLIGEASYYMDHRDLGRPPSSRLWQALCLTISAF